MTALDILMEVKAGLDAGVTFHSVYYTSLPYYQHVADECIYLGWRFLPALPSIGTWTGTFDSLPLEERRILLDKMIALVKMEML